MMKYIRSSAFFGIFSGALLFSAQVQAITIGFEGSGASPGDPAGDPISPVLPWEEAGFVLHNSSPAPESNIFHKDTDGLPNSGSDFFGFSFGGAVELEAENGDSFTLNSIDAGHIGDPNLAPDVLTLTIIGHLAAGGTVSTTIDYTNPWATYNLPATFTGLSSVEFKTSNDGSAGIDNIVVNRVPEAGSSLLLLTISGLTLASLRRRFAPVRRS